MNLSSNSNSNLGQHQFHPGLLGATKTPKGSPTFVVVNTIKLKYEVTSLTGANYYLLIAVAGTYKIMTFKFPAEMTEEECIDQAHFEAKRAGFNVKIIAGAKELEIVESPDGGMLSLYIGPEYIFDFFYSEDDGALEWEIEFNPHLSMSQRTRFSTLIEQNIKHHLRTFANDEETGE